jgi:hypothetical protein
VRSFLDRFAVAEAERDHDVPDPRATRGQLVANDGVRSRGACWRLHIALIG